MAPSPTIVLLHYSPWSERVRWAFDHHGLEYQKIDHLPVLGELRLRRIVGRRSRPATVPVLVDGDTVLTDSWDIVRYADRHGKGSPLIPAEREGEVRRWNELAEATMKHGRALVVAGLLRTPEALDETMPAAVPGWLRRMSRPINRWGTRWFARKYGVRVDEPGPHEAKLREGLGALRAGLGEGSYLLGGFSYADIVMATVLQGVTPVADEFLRLGPATREVWTHAGLAAEFSDLLRWRDTLYQRHRARRVRSAR